MAGFFTVHAVEILAGVTGLAAVCMLLSSLLDARGIWDLDQGPGLLARLKKRRERLIRALKDLEDERDAGLLAEDEFRALRHDFKRRAIAAARELERARRSRLRLLEKDHGRLSSATRRRVDILVAKRKENA
jgi:biopolymer transport protein ExbB/TolQ